MKIQAQVTIGAGSEPLPMAVLEVISDQQNGVLGGLRLPQLTESQIEILTSEILKLSPDPAAVDRKRARGLMIFNTTTSCAEVWIGTEFKSFCGDIGPADIEFYCTDAITITGTYKKGKPLNSLTDYITVPVTVKRSGMYIITATTGNGYAFETNGTLLEVGDHVLTLRGQGTPINTGTNSLSFEFNGDPILTGCGKSITVASAEVGAATLTDLTVYPKGKYVKGAPLNNTNTISLLAIFGTAGTASFEITVDGMTFTGGGNYTVGTHTVVLSGTGTPTIIGDRPLAIKYNEADVSTLGGVTIGANSATFIKVISRAIKILGLGYDLYQPGSAKPTQSARAIPAYTKNFGSIYNYAPADPANNSTYLVDGITIVDGGNTTRESLATLLSTAKPDIVVMGYAYALLHLSQESTRAALANYVNGNHGVLITLTEGAETNVADLIGRICANTPTVHGTGTIGGGYKFVSEGSINRVDSILKGPFQASQLDNLYEKWWGEDAGSTGRLSALPSDAYALSYDNQTDHTTEPTAIVHSTKGFIWIGDGGFIAGTHDTTNGSDIIYPCRNLGGLPAAKSYTVPNIGGSGTVSANVYNSYFYANALAWAIGWVNANQVPY